MQVLAKHRFTAREYHRMAETGVLKSDARVELLDGQIIDMSPIGPSHGGASPPEPLIQQTVRRSLAGGRAKSSGFGRPFEPEPT